MKHKPNNTIRNPRSSFDYELGDSLLVGIELTGAETKALRKNQGHLKGSYVTVRDGELWLLNATVTGDNRIRVPEEEFTRSRRLLAKRKEIDQLIAEKQRGSTIVPIEILNRGRFIKLRIAPGRGKRQYDKRQKIKKREDQIAASRSIKHSMN
jgi:SsrA-binding protein